MGDQHSKDCLESFADDHKTSGNIQGSDSRHSARVKYDEWIGRKDSIVSGEIQFVGKDFLMVMVEGRDMAVMYRSEWVPKEYGLYRPNQTMRFMIHSLKWDPEFIFRLTRSSLQLPAKLLEERFPEYRFVCKRRFIGQKSLILTNAKINKDLINACKEIAGELSGEFLELKPFY